MHELALSTAYKHGTHQFGVKESERKSANKYNAKMQPSWWMQPQMEIRRVKSGRRDSNQ